MGATGSSRRRNSSRNLRDSGGQTCGGIACFSEEIAKNAATSDRKRQGAPEAGSDMTKLKDLKERLMQDPEFQEEYERIDEEYSLIESLVRARTEANLTQGQLAKRLGTTQSAVARMEGGRVSPSIATIRRYARATGKRLEIELVSAEA